MRIAMHPKAELQQKKLRMLGLVAAAPSSRTAVGRMVPRPAVSLPDGLLACNGTAVGYRFDGLRRRHLGLGAKVPFKRGHFEARSIRLRHRHRGAVCSKAHDRRSCRCGPKDGEAAGVYGLKLHGYMLVNVCTNNNACYCESFRDAVRGIVSLFSLKCAAPCPCTPGTGTNSPGRKSTAE